MSTPTSTPHRPPSEQTLPELCTTIKNYLNHQLSNPSGLSDRARYQFHIFNCFFQERLKAWSANGENLRLPAAASLPRARRRRTTQSPQLTFNKLSPNEAGFVKELLEVLLDELQLCWWVGVKGTRRAGLVEGTFACDVTVAEALASRGEVQGSEVVGNLGGEGQEESERSDFSGEDDNEDDDEDGSSQGGTTDAEKGREGREESEWSDLSGEDDDEDEDEDGSRQTGTTDAEQGQDELAKPEASCSGGKDEDEDEDGGRQGGTTDREKVQEGLAQSEGCVSGEEAHDNDSEHTNNQTLPTNAEQGQKDLPEPEPSRSGEADDEHDDDDDDSASESSISSSDCSNDEPAGAVPAEVWCFTEDEEAFMKKMGLSPKRGAFGLLGRLSALLEPVSR